MRGLSSLLILDDLMRQINDEIRLIRGSEEVHSDVQPHEIFEFVAGTSTGGLIAIMLGKLGMTVEECIQAYRELSIAVFGKKNIKGRLSSGFGTSKYSSVRLSDAICMLIKKKCLPENIPMVANGDDDTIPW